jgi:tetratricopeptide (TPR) repeat protein
MLKQFYAQLVRRGGGAPADVAARRISEKSHEPAASRIAVRAWMAADDYPSYDWTDLIADPLRERFVQGLAGRLDAVRLQPLLDELSSRNPAEAIDRMLCADALLQYGLHREAESLLETMVERSDRLGARAAAILAHRCFDRGDFTRARCLIAGAARVAPESGYCQLVLGQLCEFEGRHEEAIAHFRRAHALRPVSTRFLGHLAVALLGRGEIAEGLRTWVMVDYLLGLYPQMPLCPVWDGRPLGRDRLLVVTHFGFGDIIQFLRFARLLREREPQAHLSIAVPAPLARLAADSGYFDAVHEDGVDRAQFDWQVSQMQLTLLLGVSMADVASFGAYLNVPAERIAAAGTWLPARRPGTRRVGLRWFGRDLPFNAKRSIPFELLRPLFSVAGIEWVALAEDAGSLASLGEHPLLDVSRHINDFHDTAALASNLDLVLSVDTSVVHLTGALALPVWMMARPDYEWRWGSDGDTGPWYESVRVFRHHGEFDWAAMVAEVEGALRQWIAQPGSAGLPDPKYCA